MSELRRIQKDLGVRRKEKAGTNLSLQKAKAALESIMIAEEKELRSADGRLSEARKEYYRVKKSELQGEIGRLAERQKSLRAELDRISESHFRPLDPEKEVRELSDEFPILLFPLRLETRFMSHQGSDQLWIRVYPDDININGKEELLSESELANAKNFWIEIWKAGGVEAEERGAWRTLVNHHGSGRSSWIINQYRPTGTFPKKPDDSHKILVAASSGEWSAEELDAAAGYWRAVWLARGNRQLIDEALHLLIEQVGESRAEKIGRELVPANLQDEVPDDITGEQVHFHILPLPSEVDPVTTLSSWTQPPRAEGMPDRFVAVLDNGGNKKSFLFDNPVIDNLPVGPDPQLGEDEQIKKDENGDLLINEDLLWMTDFDKAVEAGMATRIDLNSMEASRGFDKLYVTGIRFSSDEAGGKELIEKLLTDHLHSKGGFELLRQGTPTNNTEDASSGYSWEEDADKSFEGGYLGSFEENGDQQVPGEQSDGRILADMLGIDPAVLRNVPNARGTDQMEAAAMNSALFPATLGYFMEEMMHPEFSETDIEATRQFFTGFVSGRGPVPAIRIGRQPYGILPVSVWSRMIFYEKHLYHYHSAVGDAKYPYLARLHKLLMKIDTSWDSFLSQVSRVGKRGDPHQILLDIIGLHPGSVEYHQRYAQSVMQIYNQLILTTRQSYARKIVKLIKDRGKTILRKLDIELKNEELPVLEKYFLSKPELLDGGVVDDVPDSETDPIRAYTNDGLNYIGWLAGSDAETIRIQNFGGNPAPTTLLYLLLRHALMQSQSDAAARFLVTGKIIENKNAFFDPDFIHVQERGGGKSKFEALYNNNPSVTGDENTRLIDHIYKAEVLNNTPEARRLKENLASLAKLEKIPTARLERLLSEHLDSCNYRIDSWKTGLAGYKLKEQRHLSQRESGISKGLYLGAYGWLLDVRPEKRTLTDADLPVELKEIFTRGTSSPIKKDSTNLGYIHAPSLNQAAAAAILRNAYNSANRSGGGNENPYAIDLSSARVRVALSILEGIRNGQTLSALLGYQFERGLHDSPVETDKFIYPLRKVFPLVADNMEDTKSDISESIESVEANNVIDGLKLIGHVGKLSGSDRNYPFGVPADFKLPAAGPDEAKVINETTERVLDIHDAISDLVIAEEVYQVVQGNFERASGNTSAFSKGSYPPETDVNNTPGSGVTLTQRMAIHFDTTASPDSSPYRDSGTGEVTLEMTPRAKAEPSVNKWLASILPAPENVLCSIKYHLPGDAKKEITISQQDIGLQPIDLLYSFNIDTGRSMTALDDRIERYLRYDHARKAGFEELGLTATDIEIAYTGKVGNGDRTKVSFFELAALIGSLRKILTSVPVLDPSKLTLSGDQQEEDSRFDTVQLRGRIVAAQGGLDAVRARIHNILTGHGRDVDKEAEPITADDHEALINSFYPDFADFGTLAEEVSVIFSDAALYNDQQTGTGFIHAGTGRVQESIRGKLGKLTERWDNKSDLYATLMSDYDSAATDEERLEILGEAESVISSELSYEPEQTVEQYKNNIAGKKALFDGLLGELRNLGSGRQDSVYTLIAELEPLLAGIGNYDAVAFDGDDESSDLGSEKLMLILLREDIFVALYNLGVQITGKIESADKHIALSDETTVNADKTGQLQSAAKELFGEEALLLPHFSLGDEQGNEFANSFASSEGLLRYLKEEVDETERSVFPVEDWLAGVSRVREKVHCWENVSSLANAFNPRSMPEVTPLQFPFREKDRWLAMKFRDDNEGDSDFLVDGDKLLYTAHFAGAFDRNQLQCGVVIDEWTEVIPGREKTSGIAFHYNQPDSEPPQTMLLLAPPAFTGRWEWEDIIASLDETLEMVKKRAVEPSMIEKSAFAQFLPTTMMAVTLHWITVATNLAINNYVYKRVDE